MSLPRVMGRGRGAACTLGVQARLWGVSPQRGTYRCFATQPHPPHAEEPPAPTLSRTFWQLVAWVPVALFVTGHVVSIASVKGTSMSVGTLTDLADVQPN